MFILGDLAKCALTAFLYGYDERIYTIKYAKKAGMEVCSGMIIGLGEDMHQRIEHSFLLRELNRMFI